MRTFLTFATITTLLKAERWIRQQAIPYRIEPTPRVLTSDCGMAIRLTAGAGCEVRALLENQGVVCQAHELEG